MAHMQTEIHKAGYFLIETNHGTECVPDFVIGRTVSTHVEAFLNYLEGSPIDDDGLIEYCDGFVCRMSAPGYLDCTDWCAFATEQQCVDFLEQMYSEEC